MARRRARGVASAIPRKYRGVSLETARRSPTWRATGRRLRSTRSVRRLRRADRRAARRGGGLWLMGDVGTGKTTLAMLVSKAAVEAERTVAIYSLPSFWRGSARTYDADGGRLLPRVLRSPDLGRPPARRRPGRREAQRLGAGAALRDRQRALRDGALDGGHHEPRPAGARGADRPAHRLPPGRDLRRPRCRCSGTTCDIPGLRRTSGHARHRSHTGSQER